MIYFKTLELQQYNFDSLYSYTDAYIYARSDLIVKPSGNLSYWYRWIIDGVESMTKAGMIRSPSLSYNNVTAQLFVKDSIVTAKLRVWEVNPDTNPAAEYIESNEISNIKVNPWLSAPKIACTMEIETDPSIWLNSTSWLDYYSVENLKVYDHESSHVIFNGPSTLIEQNNRFPITINKPAKNVALHTIIAEWTLKDLSKNVSITTQSVCSMFPRFDQGEFSVITDFMPFRTHDGKKITKLPVVTNANQNVQYDLNVHKSAVSGRNYDETVPGATFESGEFYAATEYYNNRTGSTTYGNAYVDVGEPARDLKTSRMDANLYGFNTVTNGGDIKVGDVITPKLTLNGSDVQIDKPNLTSELCITNFRDMNELRFVSMPPLDLSKPFYEIETFKSENDFLPFANINTSFGSGEPLEFTTNKMKFNLIEMAYPNDMYISMSQASIWYPDINTIDYLNDPYSGQSQIRPLITTKKEKVTIKSDKTPVAGQSLTLSAEAQNLIEINIGTHNFVWKKNGVVIPGKTTSFIEFAAISPDDNGAYTVEYTILPKGIQADDSSIKMVSAVAFDINVPTQNPLTMVVKAVPTDIVIGSPLTVDGTITIATNTISKSELYKDNVKIKDFATSELNPTYEVLEAAETDAGVYQFKIAYMDGPVSRVYTSEAITVIYDGQTPIDFTVDITVPIVNNGEQATLVGKVNITTPPAGITYVYQWHRGIEGAIVGEDDKDLVIAQTSADDIGEYWLSVLAKAPNRASTLKASPHKNLIVRQDGQLRFNIVAEHNIVADGKPAKLSMNYSANQQVSPTWDWYANGEKIVDSKDKATIEHIGFGDVIYYVMGKPTATNVIASTSQSNLVIVKGVVAVESLTLAIDGPIEASLGERVLFDAIISETNHNQYSNTLNPDDYSYEWYKGSTKIGSGKEIRIYAASDAGGDYTYKIISKVDSTISKTSPVHKFKIKEETPVSVTLPATKSLKVGEKLELTPTITPADDVDTKFQWMKNGSAIVGKTTKTLTIEAVAKSDSGIYTVSVTDQSTPTVSTPCVLTVRDDVTPPDPEPIEGDWYIHDLRPGRDRGFTWMGWWVLDEIQKAINDDFDWIADPTNKRFKYQNVLKALADNKDTWEDIEIQESRNGYILLLSDLTPTGI